MAQISGFSLEEFKHDQREALLSMEEVKIRAFAKKYGQTLPSTSLIFWEGVHKAITALTNLPLEVRKESKKWLDEHNFKSWDDGEL